MTGRALLRTLLRGALLGTATYVALAHVVLPFGPRPASWLWPTFVLLGAVLLVRRPRDAHGMAKAAMAPRLPAWLRRSLLGSALPFGLLVIGIVTHAVLTCPPVDWDGMTTWEFRARVFTEPAPFDSPFVTDPRIYSTSREYPLLLPVLQSACAQLLPSAGFGTSLHLLLYLGMIALVAEWACTKRGFVPWPVFPALAATAPIWWEIGMGSVDSGFADIGIAAWLTALALGLLRDDPLLVASSAALLVWTKPEGSLYVAFATLAAVAVGRRAWPLALGYGISLLLWLPAALQLSGGILLEALRPPLLGAGLVVLAGLAQFGCTRLGDRAPLERRLQRGPVAGRRLWLGLAILLLLLLGLDRLQGESARLPATLGFGLTTIFSVKEYGTVFWTLAVALLWRPRDAAAIEPAARALLLTLALGLSLALLAFYVYTGEHTTREEWTRLVRLGSHWTGLGVCVLVVLLQGPPRPVVDQRSVA